jgi:SMODS and SLOG-associating 2TM effector domain 1/SMODS and SLOG-associating 2TM effector domain 3
MNSTIEYPDLQLAASAASDSAQKKFLYLNVAQLSILFLVASVSGWNPSEEYLQRIISVLVGIGMFVALIFATLLRIQKFDDCWFRSRALAENIKSLVWCFVMSPNESIAGSESKYHADVNQLRDRLKEVAKEVGVYDRNGPLMTPWMKKTQQLDLKHKLTLYRSHRINDQQNWYHKKAVSNAKAEKNWFVSIFIVEFLAVGYAVLQAVLLWQFNAVAGIAALSAAFIGWIQTKRFSDLATSYRIAAEDLRKISAMSENVSTEEEVNILVREVEAAVSREHTLWIANRIR